MNEPTNYEALPPTPCSLHPDVEALRNRMCGYSTACVSVAIIEYFKLPDCSQSTRREIYNYLSENTPAQEGKSFS